MTPMKGLAMFVVPARTSSKPTKRLVLVDSFFIRFTTSFRKLDFPMPVSAIITRAGMLLFSRKWKNC